MATKSFYIGPQDGWTEVVTGAEKYCVRISAYPHTHPFFVFGDASATPDADDNGVHICHCPFEINSAPATGGNVDVISVRVQNPAAGSRNRDGRIRIDVYTDGTVA